MPILCEICEYAVVSRYYRDYRGPHAICDDCFDIIVRPKLNHYYSILESNEEEYLEEVVIDRIMEA